MMREGAAFLRVAPFPIYIILIASQYLRKLMLCPPGASMVPGGFKTRRSTGGCTIRPDIGCGRKAVTGLPRFIAGRESGELLLQLGDVPFQLGRVEVRMDLHQFLLIGLA